MKIKFKRLVSLVLATSLFLPFIPPVIPAYAATHKVTDGDPSSISLSGGLGNSSIDGLHPTVVFNMYEDLSDGMNGDVYEKLKSTNIPDDGGGSGKLHYKFPRVSLITNDVIDVSDKSQSRQVVSLDFFPTTVDTSTTYVAILSETDRIVSSSINMATRDGKYVFTLATTDVVKLLDGNNLTITYKTLTDDKNIKATFKLRSDSTTVYKGASFTNISAPYVGLLSNSKWPEIDQAGKEIPGNMRTAIAYTNGLDQNDENVLDTRDYKELFTTDKKEVNNSITPMLFKLFTRVTADGKVNVIKTKDTNIDGMDVTAITNEAEYEIVPTNPNSVTNYTKVSDFIDITKIDGFNKATEDSKKNVTAKVEGYGFAFNNANSILTNETTIGKMFNQYGVNGTSGYKMTREMDAFTKSILVHVKNEIVSSQAGASNNVTTGYSEIADIIDDPGGSYAAYSFLVNKFFSHTAESKVKAPDSSPVHYPGGNFAKTNNTKRVVSLTNYSFFDWVEYKDGDKVFTADQDNYVDTADSSKSFPTGSVANDKEKASNTGEGVSGVWHDRPKSGAGITSSMKYLSAEEDLRLRIMYNIYSQYFIVSDPTDTNYVKYKPWLDKIMSMEFRYSITDPVDLSNQQMTTKRTPNFIGFGTKNSVTSDEITGMTSRIPADATTAAAAVDNMKGSTGSMSPGKVAANLEYIMQYLAYGASGTNAEYQGAGGTNANTGAVKYSDVIDQVVPPFLYETGANVSRTDEDKINMPVLDWSDYKLPSIPGLGGISNDNQGVTCYARMLLSLIYVKRYAAVPKKEAIDSNNNRVLQYGKGTLSPFSKLEYNGTDDNVLADTVTYEMFSCSELDTFLTEEANKSEKSTALPDNINDIIAAYIGIYKGMKYIQYIDESGAPTATSKDWMSPEIEAICRYYSQIEPYADLADTEGSSFTEGEPTRAFKMFFGDEYEKFTTYYMQGVAASATYVPLITNTYEYESISVLNNDTDFIQKFHYKYGFNRKALYIDTNVNAATRAYVTGQKDSLRVARLKDFIDADKDIVLYIDPSMYNIKEVAEKQNLSYNAMQNTPEAGEEDEGLITNAADWWAEKKELDAESICKTGSSSMYSTKLANDGNIRQFGVDGKEQKFSLTDKNHYLMSTPAIEEALSWDEYNPIQAFAVVSAIYRDRQAFSVAYNTSISVPPVFISSRSTPIMGNVSTEEFNSIYNYMLVKNLSRKLGMNYNVELDMNSPVFMDVYGNILTESGLVIIPAVANATMFKGSVPYNSATAAMATLYGDVDSVKISAAMANIKEMMLTTGAFLEDHNGMVVMTNHEIDGTKISVDSLNTSSKTVRRKLYNAAMTYAGDALGENGDPKFNQRFGMILEVMRGAPIESIDYQQEGLSGITNINKTGIYLASKVEEISDILMSNSDGNSLLQLPNIAFMPGAEYVVVIGAKVLIAIMLFVMVIKLMIDGITGALGVRTIASMTSTIALIIISIVAIPILLNYSYYQTNKTLIQKEASYIGMLNLEKASIGQEIGVKEITTPKTTSKMYLKLDSVDVPWWNVAMDLFSDNKILTMKEMYQKAYSSSIFSSFKGIETRGSGLYININDVYDSSEVRFRKLTNDDDSKTETGELYQNINGSVEMSYVIPYYAIMDTLIADINRYNEINSTGAYTTKVISGNPNSLTPRAGVSTVGMIKAYLLSNTFLEGTYDTVGLYKFYEAESGYTRPYGTVLDSNIEAQKLAMWCMVDKYTEEEIKYKLEELDQRVKDWIVDNRGLLDQITDETFLKSLAMYASTQHNDIFKVPAARSLEVMSLDTRDILRLALANKDTVVKGAQCSLARFIYNEGGTISVIMLVFLLLIFWITSLIKPLVTYVLFVLLLWKFVSKQLVRDQGQRAFQGYLISMGILCFVNVIYALLVKMALGFPSFGASILVCSVFQLALQVVYVAILLWLLKTVTADAENIGMYGYSKFFDATMSGPINSTRMHVDRLTTGTLFGRNTEYMRGQSIGRNSRSRGITGESIMEEFRNRDNRRITNAQEYRRRR